tara:strand:- start:151808 stop:153085 length:1278 start_codon:yes stop_codon:yes gene_type:complete
MDYNVIYDFCKVRNHGTAMANGTEEYPPRVKFILELLEKLNITYEVDTFLVKGNNLHNIYLKGTNDKWIMAHHDVCNHTIDNANDNSASVINAIGLKTIRPDMNVVLVDGEEPPFMGAGSGHFAQRYLDKTIDVEWVVNLELSCAGGENFFIGSYGNDISNRIENKFGCAVMNTPFNDASVLVNNAGINAALINPCPLKEGELKIKQVGLANDILNAAEAAKPKPKSKYNWGSWLNGGSSLGGNVDDVFDDFEDIDDDFDDIEDFGDGITDADWDEIDFDFDGNIKAWKASKEESTVDNDKTEDVEELEIEDPKPTPVNKKKSWGWDSWNSGRKDFHRGDTISQYELEKARKELKANNFRPQNDSEKFIVEFEPTVVEPGKMPTLSQMETSILWRCHTKDDTVEHVRTDDMKDFVEKVLAPICEL